MTLLGISLANRPAALAAAAVIVAVSQFAAAQELPKNFVTHAAPKVVPPISFEDGKGRTRSLADFKGKVVLLNIWATWCASCRYEMPSLDGLQTHLGSSDFEVLPLSIDRSGIDAAKKFYTETEVRNLPIYIDTSGKVLRELGAVGLPTTLVIDRAGQETARIVGPAEWDAPEIVAFLKSVIARPATPVSTAQADLAPTDNDSEWSVMRGIRWLKQIFIK